MGSPPADDVVEVTVLGPGLGESVIVHLGGGEWLIADCCVGRGRNAAPLGYLDSLGVAPEAVRWLVATHWHDDHVRGFGDLVDACGQAQVVHAAALELDEFMTLVEGSEELMLRGTSGVDEMRKTRDILDRAGRRRPLPATADTRLDQHPGDGHRPSFEIWSLSPSPAALLDAMADFANWAARPGEPKRAISAPPRNPSAVVLLIRVGLISLLLGSDLETESTQDRGWEAILRSTGRPTAPSCFLKVPHHGSATGHHGGIWTDLLEADAHAVVTPMRQGRVDLPKPEDLARIAAATPNGWLTRSNDSAPSPRRSPAVERTLGEHGLQPRAIALDPGRVTLRRLADGTGGWSVDAPRPAVQVT